MDKFSAIIIEDSESTVELIAQCFEELENVELLGYAVNGKDGYDAIKEHQPDLVTLDINMPLMDGLELLEKIREENLPIKVLVVSGVLDDETLNKVNALNPDGFLEKPFQPAFVRDKIKEILFPTAKAKVQENPQEKSSSTNNDSEDKAQEKVQEKPKKEGKKWRNDDGSFDISFEPSEFDFQYNGEIKEFKPLKVSGTPKGRRIPVKDTETKRIKEKDLVYKPYAEEVKENSPEKSEKIQETLPETPDISYKAPEEENSETLYRTEPEVVENPKKENTDDDLLKEFFNEENGIEVKEETPEKILEESENDFKESFNTSNNNESEYVENKNIKEKPDKDEIEFDLDKEEELVFSMDDHDNEESEEDFGQNDDLEDIEFVLDDNEEEPEEEVLDSDFEQKFDAYVSDLRREQDKMSSIAASHTVVNDRESLFTAPINVGLEKELQERTTEDTPEDIFNEDKKIEVAIKPPRIDFNKFNVKEETEKKYERAPEIIDGGAPEEEVEENFIDKMTNKAQGLFDKVQNWLKN